MRAAPRPPRAAAREQRASLRVVFMRTPFVCGEAYHGGAAAMVGVEAAVGLGARGRRGRLAAAFLEREGSMKSNGVFAVAACAGVAAGQVSWTQRATTGPSPRSAHRMDFDPARGVTGIDRKSTRLHSSH